MYVLCVMTVVCALHCVGQGLVYGFLPPFVWLPSMYYVYFHFISGGHCVCTQYTHLCSLGVYLQSAVFLDNVLQVHLHTIEPVHKTTERGSLM